MSEKPREILIITEGVVQSLVRDAGTFALFVGLIGIGWFLESPAMQWTGAIVGFVTIIAVASGRKSDRTFTIEAARAELDRLEAKS